MAEKTVAPRSWTIRWGTSIARSRRCTASRARELEALQRDRDGASLRRAPRRASRSCASSPTGSASTALRDFDDVVPLLFPHTVFKSYPASLLDKKRFDLMTKWLGKVTSYDLSRVDTRGLRQHRRVDRPARRADAARGDHVVGHDRHAVDHPEGQGRRELHDEALAPCSCSRRFGREPTPEEIDPVVDVIWPNHASGKLGHLRMAAMLEARVHRRRREPLPRALRRGDQHRPDVPGEQDARGGVARRARPPRDRSEAARAQGRVHRDAGAPAAGDGGVLRPASRASSRASGSS